MPWSPAPPLNDLRVEDVIPKGIKSTSDSNAVRALISNLRQLADTL